MTIKEKQQELINEFKEIEDWDDRYAKIIKMGKELPDFNEEYRIEKNKIEGCQSQVWIHAEIKEGKVSFEADSDAMIVKGLIAMILKVYSNHKPEEILNSPPDFINEIGIDKHLSLTRKNGLGAMLKQIQMFALAYKALAK
ncbi:MAG: SufE family protein [Ignavibacteriae bacterium]|nr:SufE family protein [Ignavibacteriota bacterium]NOG98123.1 SufE family protein [Ignavibacteriota bacterium]